MNRPQCDFELGDRPATKPCGEPPIFECVCRRCEEDPFRSCAAHLSEVLAAHARVFPNHEVRWVRAATSSAEPVPAATTYGSCNACGSPRAVTDADRWGRPVEITDFPRLFDGNDHLIMRHTPFDLRCLGWAVAVHNDYRLHGEHFTFWLLTKDDRCVKGEGKTDLEALDSIRETLRAQGR